MKSFLQDFVDEIGNEKPDKLSLDKLKVRLAKRHKIAKIPKYNEILLSMDINTAEKLKWIVGKPARTISGVAPISIMSKPSNCPSQARCTFCPGGINSPFGNTPKSYTGNEPASRRAARNNFDPYLQVMNRIEQYLVNNHVPEKVELIIQGGTFTAFSDEYQQQFIAYALKAMNDFSSIFFNKNLDAAKFKSFFMLPASIKDMSRVSIINSKLLSIKGTSSLMHEKNKNETAKIRCIGLTIETRPDYGMLSHGNNMLELGTTRVELGIQSVYEEVLVNVKRGHTVEDTIKSIAILKDLGFKINAHYMLGLPGSTMEKDLAGLNELFSNQVYRPDMMKIYPCLVMKGTELYEEWKQGDYKALETKDAARIIAEFKKNVPEYCRIMRIQRDIPTNVTEAGVDRTNLRQYVKVLMDELGYKCRCIRCREAGRASVIEEASTISRSYDASNGKEFFISAEDSINDVLLGFCRLRYPSNSLREEITDSSAIIRELHVYGRMAGLGSAGHIQHHGLGFKLLKKAEEIAISNNKDKMIVISGVGVREYYRKHGYSLQGPYMVKSLG